MPIDQPYREAEPSLLEANLGQCELVSNDGEYVPFYNSGSNVYQQGEFFVAGAAVWLCLESILPGKTGTRTMDFVVDAKLDPAHTGNIAQDALIYIDTEVTDAANPLGYATATEPDNGFVLGRATCKPGAKSVNVAGTGSDFVRVRSSAKDYAVFAD